MSADNAIGKLCALILLYALAQWITDAHAAATLTLLPNSANPATMAECEGATGQRPRHVISKQDRTGEPFHHRTCIE